MSVEGMIFDIKEFTVHDGPGIRITVFLKGCPLKCEWCHNPEGISFKREIAVIKSFCKNCGRCLKACRNLSCIACGECVKVCDCGARRLIGEIVDSKILAGRLKEYESFLTGSGGGITISGGEPLAQPDFLIDLLKELKPLNTAVETSGFGLSQQFRQVVELSDLILFDIKHADPTIHKKLTRSGNEPAILNLRLLIESGKKFIVRIPLIPGINDSRENMEQTALLLKDAHGLERVELMPYNRFAGSKYGMLGLKYCPSFDENQEIDYYKDVFDLYGIQSVYL